MDGPEPEILQLEHGTVDLRERRFRGCDGTEVGLSQREADLLRALASGEVVPRDDLLERLWGWRGSTETRAVDAAIRRLRAKIEPEPGEPRVLLGVYGEGFRLVLARPTLAALPRPLAPLRGRDALVEDVEAALSERPLVTLVGPGGIGKTRLALELAHRAHERGRAVLFVELEAARTEDEARHQVAAALHVSLPPVGDPDDAIAAALPAGLLLVLDNLEQVAGPIAGPLARWLSADVTALATTREALSLPGELAVQVPPLDAAVARSLYVERAETAGRAPSPDEGDAVGALVQRLDGSPLAIELAAAWAPILEPAEVAFRLAEGDLADPGRGRPARHASLDAVVDWSWALLSDEEQRVAEACSLFPASFATDAVQEVVDAPVAGPLLGLRRKSLLHPAPGAGRRLAMTGVVRAFAAVRRQARGHDAWVARFAVWCMRQAAELPPRSPELGALVASLPVLDGAQAAGLVLALGPALDTAGWFRVHRAAIDDVLAKGVRDPEVRTRLLVRRAAMAQAVGALDEAGPLIAGALQAARELDEPLLLAEVLLERGSWAALVGDRSLAEAATDEGLARLTEAEGPAGRLGRAWLVAAANEVDLGRRSARDSYERARRAFAEAGVRQGQAAALVRIANLCLADGDLDGATTHLARGAALLPEGPTAALLRVRGLVAEARGDLDEAEADAGRVLELAEHAGEPWTQHDAHLALGRVALARDDRATAARHAETALAFAEAVGWDTGRARAEALLRLTKGPGV